MTTQRFVLLLAFMVVAMMGVVLGLVAVMDHA
jgi:hypothetical protein